MFRRLRKPVTHAAALWMLVGLAAGMLLAVMAYISILAGIRSGGARAFPAKFARPAEQLPTLFGKVCSTGIDGRLTVVSKQAFDAVLIDDATVIRAIGGDTIAFPEIPVGGIVTVTGKDLGGRAIAASAVTLVSRDHGDAFGDCPDASGLGRAPENWIEAWSKLPALYAWNDDAEAGEPVVAVREFAPLVPAASYELRDAKGKTVERIEIDVEGLTRRKPGNPFLIPAAAEEALYDRGFRTATGRLDKTEDGTIFSVPAGHRIRILPPNFVQGIGLRLEVLGGDIFDAVRFRELAAVGSWKDVRHEYAVSPDSRYLMAVFAGRDFARSVHVVDIKAIGIEWASLSY